MRSMENFLKLFAACRVGPNNISLIKLIKVLTDEFLGCRKTDQKKILFVKERKRHFFQIFFKTT